MSKILIIGDLFAIGLVILGVVFSSGHVGQKVISSSEQCNIKLIDGMMQTIDCETINEYSPVPAWRWGYNIFLVMLSFLYIITFILLPGPWGDDP